MDASEKFGSGKGIVTPDGFLMLMQADKTGMIKEQPTKADDRQITPVSWFPCLSIDLDD